MRLAIAAGFVAVLLTGLPAAAQDLCVRGAQIAVLWKGEWYPATVNGSRGVAGCAISYDGYDASWNEFVPDSRMRARSAVPPRPLTPLQIKTAIESAVPVVPLHEYVEAMRPRMAPRALTADERAQRDAAIRAFAADKGERHLIALKPLAETGDKAALAAVIDGYANYFVHDGPARPDDATKARWRLLANWGVASWRLYGQDPRAAKAVQSCVRNFGGNTIGDCGFEVIKDPKDDYDLNDYADRGKGRGWRNATFVDKPVPSQMVRVEQDLARIANGEEPLGGELQMYRSTQPAIEARYQAALVQGRQASATRTQGFAAERARFDATPQLGPADKAWSEAVAYRERGQYAERWYVTYAAANPTPFEVWSWCQRGSAAACFKQDYVSPEVRARFAARDQARAAFASALRGDNLPTGNVEVRTYDQNGVYQGSTTMGRDVAGAIGAR